MIIYITSSLVISLPMAIFISLITIFYSIYRINKNKFDMAAVFSIGVIIISMFYTLGVYLSSYFKPLAIFVPIAGMIFSLIIMFFYFFWKEGKKRVEFVVKNETADIDEKATLQERVKGFIEAIIAFNTIRKQAKEQRSNGHSKIFSYQLAFVNYQREKSFVTPKNAIDFAILKEVELNRNEYSEADGKRRYI